MRVLISVVGAGSIGRRHVGNLIAMGHRPIVVDSNPEALARLKAEHPDAIVSGYGLAMSELQALLICTPAATHADVARSWRDAGARCALFVEKPLALSVADCAVFRDWPHPTTMVGYMLRHHPKAQAMKLLFPLGTVIGGRFYCVTDTSTWGSKLSGPLILEASHELDLALWFGAPALALAEAVGESEMRLQFKEASYSSPWHVQVSDAPGRYLRLWDIDADMDKGAEARFESKDELGDQMYVDELAHFLACAAKGIPTITPFADGIRVVEVCEQALKMANA